MSYDFIVLLGVGVLAFASIATLLATFSTVELRTAAIVQRFGRFTRAVGSGIRAKIPFADTSAAPYGHKHQASKHAPGNGGAVAKR